MQMQAAMGVLMGLGRILDNLRSVSLHCKLGRSTPSRVAAPDPTQCGACPIAKPVSLGPVHPTTERAPRVGADRM
eukprot:scaffold1084_cov30-Tisochrysis_lutea.AAC.1